MDSPLFYEDTVGQSWTSPRRTVTEADVVNFATMTGDFNPLHVDYDYAAKTPYRQPIAHGLLGLSWVAGLGSYFPNMNTVAFTAVRNWEFVRPLFFGDTVCVETTCMQKDAAGRRNGKVIWERRLLNQSQQIVQQGSFETLVATKNVVRKPKFRDDQPEPRSAVYSTDHAAEHHANSQREVYGREDIER